MNRKDQQILAEAYQASHLKQHLPNLTIEQLHVVIENASPTELDVIEEWAVLNGCSDIQAVGRKYLSRSLKSFGYEQRYITVGKAL